MAFFAQVISIWLLLWVVSRFLFREKLRSHKVKARIAFAIAYMIIGTIHLISPDSLTYMVENLFPYPKLLVIVSGMLEIALGILLLIPRFQRLAAWGIIILLVLVFPANINVAINQLPPPGGLPQKEWYVWSRLLFQPVYIFWVWWAAIYKAKTTKTSLLAI